MRKLVFAAYEKDDFKAKSYLNWIMLWRAIYNPQWQLGGDKAKNRRVIKVLDLLDTIVDKSPDGATAVLKPSGGELVFEDAEFDLVKEAWNTFRVMQPAALAREVIAVDDLLDEAPTVDLKALQTPPAGA